MNIEPIIDLGDALMDLLPIVAHQDWLIEKSGRIRNSEGACPICAIVNEIRGESAFDSGFFSAANSSLDSLGIKTRQNREAIDVITTAADIASEEALKRLRAKRVRDQMIEVLKPKRA